MAHWCLRISLHIFSVGFLLLFECLKVGYLHMMGKITKKEKHFIILLFYLLIFMLFHFLDTFNLKYLHGIFALFHIILLKFLFWTFSFCFTDQEVYLLGYVFKYYTKHFKKKNVVSGKYLSQLSFTALYKVATWPSIWPLGRDLTIFTFLDYSGVILLWIFPITPWAKKLETYLNLPLVLNDDWTTELVCIFEGHKNWTNKIGSLGNVRSCHHI